jgi:RNA-directed DNA polymerase
VLDYEANLIKLCRKIIRHDPTRRCAVRGHPSDWDGLPPDKSLFLSRSGCGLPIGNLTSQVLANFYLNPLDHYVKHDLGIRYYGRYVDDMVFIHEDRRALADVVVGVRAFLRDSLGLRLHPRKVYLQHITKGAPFLGVHVSPQRILAGRRTKGNFSQAIGRQNRVADDHRPTKRERDAFRSTINSYLGILSHYATFRLRVRMLYRVSRWWWRRFHPARAVSRVVAGGVRRGGSSGAAAGHRKSGGAATASRTSPQLGVYDDIDPIPSLPSPAKSLLLVCLSHAFPVGNPLNVGDGEPRSLRSDLDGESHP